MAEVPPYPALYRLKITGFKERLSLINTCNIKRINMRTKNWQIPTGKSLLSQETASPDIKNVIFNVYLDILSFCQVLGNILLFDYSKEKIFKKSCLQMWREPIDEKLHSYFLWDYNQAVRRIAKCQGMLFLY